MSLAAERGSKAKDVNFHALSGLGYVDALQKAMGLQAAMTHPPDLAGANFLSKNMDFFIAPWTAEGYWLLYESISRVIDEVDPAVIVIDTVCGPRIDATRNKRRVHALVTPNILSDLTPAKQPAWTLFWKYPALVSGLPYPVPWKLIPANIYMNFQIIRGVLSVPDISAKKRALEEKGIKRPIDFVGLYRPDVPWLTQTLPGVHIPLEETTASGKELLDWIKRPTVLINLGSGFKYSEDNAKIMMGAIQDVLKKTDVQVLWKMDKVESLDDQFLETAVRESSGRLRIEKWLRVAPPTILQKGRIVAFKHHGGAGCFHDLIGGGVPQVILPQWVDLYDMAQLAETLDIGVWGCRETSPDWTSECIQQALPHVIQDSPASVSMAKKAASFGELASKTLGRDVAAREIAILAASRHS